MRLWHQSLIPYLDRQRLLGQHRELCALRGKGWGKKHATVDYAFTHDPAWLVAYHWLVMNEMKRRGYRPDPQWECGNWRGNILGLDTSFADPDFVDDQYCYAIHKDGIIYPEHNDDYLRECINLLKEKNAPIDWEKVEQDGLLKIQPNTYRACDRITNRTCGRDSICDGTPRTRRGYPRQAE